MSRIKLNFYLDNQLIGAANNWQGISIAMTFGDEVQPEIETDELEFVLEESKTIRKWVQDGINGGGTGIYEPPELRIEIASGTGAITVFTGILDMVNDMKFIDKNKILVKLQKQGGTNQLTERSQAISFAYLHSIGEIKNSDFLNVSYVLAHIPDYQAVVMISISIYILIREVTASIRRISEIIADVSGETAGGLSGFIGAGILAAIKVIAQAVYIALLIIALINLIKTVIENLISPKRDFKCMNLQLLLEKGAEHLGYTFESTFFDDPDMRKLVILPVKEDSPNKIPDNGFPTNKGQLYTYYDMLQFFKKLINGKTVVRNGKIIIERRDFFDNQTSYVLPNILLNDFSYNANEIKSNFNLQFQVDERDDLTLIDYEVNKTTFQRITEPKVIKNKKNVMIKDLEQVNLPVALPTRKEGLTRVEKIILRLAKLIDKFVKGNKFSSQITGRIGALHLANDFTSVPKLIPIDGKSVDPGYRSIMNAEVLHDKFYFINSFVPVPVNHNQYKKFEGIRIPFCFEDYVTLSDNSFFTTSDGKQGKFERIEGNPDGTFADVDFRIKEVFTNNLKDKIV